MYLHTYTSYLLTYAFVDSFKEVEIYKYHTYIHRHIYMDVCMHTYSIIIDAVAIELVSN